MKLYVLLSILFVTPYISAQTQISIPCDSVHIVVDSSVMQINNMHELTPFMVQYYDDSLLVCIPNDSSNLVKIVIVFTIDNEGNCMDFKYKNYNVDLNCLLRIKPNLGEMPKFKPAILSGQNVCSYLEIPIELISKQMISGLRKHK